MLLFFQRITLPATHQKLKSVSPTIARLLGKLRRRIRLIVLVEGIVATFVAVLICFWVAFAIDYLPIKFGFSELSRPARTILLILAIAICLVQLYRLIGRRLFVSMKDRSLALLVEQRHPEFEESLMTTVVEAKSGDRAEVPVDQAMLEMTRSKAERLVKKVDPNDIVNFQFLRPTAFLACALAVSVIGLAIFNFDNLQLAIKRLVLLDSRKWPRRVYLELVGLKIKTDNPIPGIEELGQTLKPKDHRFRVPRGSSLSLSVRAQESDPLAPWRGLPTSCVIDFRTADGDRGTQTLNRIGNPRDGWQTWSLNGAPLERVLSNFEFSVRGEDFRDGPYHIEIVDQAIVTETNLDCVFPEYLSSNDSLSWTPRSVRWTGRASLPEGTSFNVSGEVTKPLKKAYVWNPALSEMQQAIVDGTRFEFPVNAINEPVNLEFYFLDEDNLVSDSPHRVTVEPQDDESPEVIARLVGIGTAVTPQAILPFEGEIHDDHRVQETWVELTTPKRKLPPAVQRTKEGGKLKSAIDLAELVRAGLELTVDDGSELNMIIKAKDYFCLGGNDPNVGVGDRYALELVSAGRLLRMLEQIEVSQRRRLEQIFEEVSNIRGYLSRTRKRNPKDRDLRNSEPGDRPSDNADRNSRQQAMRIVFSQRSKLQAMKSSQELRGIADAFTNLRLQLINNRLDAEDRKQRLSDKIITPLQHIPKVPLKKLAATIDEIEAALKQIDKGIGGQTAETNATELTDRGLVETDSVLKEIDAILSILVKYESQNELLEIVRMLITEQEALLKQTKDKRQKDAFEGLLD